MRISNYLDTLEQSGWAPLDRRFPDCQSGPCNINTMGAPRQDDEGRSS